MAGGAANALHGNDSDQSGPPMHDQSQRGGRQCRDRRTRQFRELRAALQRCHSARGALRTLSFRGAGHLPESEPRNSLHLFVHVIATAGVVMADFISVLVKGGYVMIPLIFFSIVAATIIIERAIALRRKSVLDPAVLDAM